MPMTDRERLLADLIGAAETLGCRLVLLPGHGSDDSPAEITAAGTKELT
jgi:hypothetical protein